MSKKTTYSKEFKESVLKRLEPPTKDTPTSLSRELNIPTHAIQIQAIIIAKYLFIKIPPYTLKIL